MEHSEFMDALEYAPAAKPRVAAGLIGWTARSGMYYCATCVGRVIGRGFPGPLGPGAIAVWDDSPRISEKKCAACAHASEGVGK